MDKYIRCFSIIYRHGLAMNNKAIRELQLNGQQIEYLMRIYSNPGISQDDLARYYKIDKGAVAKSLKYMENLGFITRTQNPKDKRAYCIYPTEKVGEVCERQKAQNAKMKEKILAGMTEEEIRMLETLLNKVTDNIEKDMEGGDSI